MKKLTQLTLVLLVMVVGFAGCEAANDAVSDVTDKAANLADVDFGDFDMKGLQEKFTGITDGFKDVTADNVDGLTEKITELDGSIGDLGVDKLEGPAKTAATGAMSTFATAIKTAMDGISDKGILGKLKPVVAPLLEKLTGA